MVQVLEVFHCLWIDLIFTRRLWMVFILTSFATSGSGAEFSATAVYETYCPENTCSVNARGPRSCSPCVSCSCEDTCQFFGTCCPDKQKDVRVYDVRCKDLRLSTYGGSLIRPVYVVSGCDYSGESSEIYRKACESGGFNQENDPRIVAHQTLSGQTIFFKNKFCAYCYNIVNFDILLPNLSCRKDFGHVSLANVTDVFKWAETSSSCSIGHVLPRGTMTLPYCEGISGPLVSQCNVTGRWVTYDRRLESACRLYLNPLSKLYDPRYKNIFCYMCNGEDLTLLTLDTNVACPDYEVWSPASLNILGNLNFLPGPQAADDDDDDIISMKHPVCNTSSAFDTLELKCKRLSCPDYYFLDGQHCEPIFLNLPANTSFHVNVLLLRNRTIGLPRNPYHNMFEKLRLHVMAELDKVDMTLKDIDIRFRSLHDSFNGYSEVDDGFLSFTAQTEKTSLQSEVTEVLLKRVSYGMAIHSGKNNRIGFYSTVIYGGKDLVVDSNGSANKHWEVSTYSVKENHHLLPLSPFPRCPLIEYDQESFEVINNWQIRHRNTNVTFNRTQYMVKSADIFVCVWHLPSTGVGKKATREIPAKSMIIVMICMTVKFAGLLCLVLTFLTLCLFSELRSICGVNLMFLVASLFVAHLIMMGGSMAQRSASASTAACPALGIVLHFSWLSSFAWMSVCTFHMYKVFRTVAPSGTNANYSCFYGYCLFAYGIPLLVVFATCAVMLLISGGGDVGYGTFDYHDICFIKSTMSAMITFAVPIVVNVLHSFSFLIKAFLSLRKASKLRKSLKHKEMNVLSHCLKLSTITGFAWVVAFVAKIAEQDSLTVVFIFLYCGQGVFIFFAFTFNRKVQKMYRKLFVALLKCSWRNTSALNESNLTRVVGSRSTSKY